MLITDRSAHVGLRCSRRTARLAPRRLFPVPRTVAGAVRRVQSSSMARLCERPGCSEVAAVAYGMQPEDLVFWLDVVRPGQEDEGGRLCSMHADSMVVPRNWTLNDLRDPDLHLFRPPPIKRAPKPRARRSHRDDTPTGVEQLSLAAVEITEITEITEPVEPVEPSPLADSDDDEVRDRRDAAPDVPVGPDPRAADESRTGAAGGGQPTSWRPDFDSADDLDGLLSARSPLLARAFRGSERRR